MAYQKLSGQSSQGTVLSMKRASGEFIPFNRLVSTPDLGGDPQKIDVTCLIDEYTQSVAGVKDPGDIQYTFQYVEAGEAESDYARLREVEKTQEVVEFKQAYPDGTGKTFKGTVNLKISGAAVNGALTFTANISLIGEFEDITA